MFPVGNIHFYLHSTTVHNCWQYNIMKKCVSTKNYGKQKYVERFCLGYLFFKNNIIC